jgi:hypothetical protein
MPTPELNLKPISLCDRFLPALLLALILSSPFAASHAQEVGQSPTTASPAAPNISPTTPQQDEGTQRMIEMMAIRRNEQRQKEIVSDTAKLLDLAQKLNAEVSKSDKNTLSISVVKEAEEIEKLARTIKEKMRDGT